MVKGGWCAAVQRKRSLWVSWLAIHEDFGDSVSQFRHQVLVPRQELLDIARNVAQEPFSQLLKHLLNFVVALHIPAFGGALRLSANLAIYVRLREMPASILTG